MTITQSTPAFYAQRNSVVAPQSAAQPGSALDQFQKSDKQEKKNSLWGKVGLTALGVGSVAGTVGFAVRALTGWSAAFPVLTMVGLAAGAALGATAWAIEHKQRQDEKKAAQEASQAPQQPAPVQQYVPGQQPTIEIK